MDSHLGVSSSTAGRHSATSSTGSFNRIGSSTSSTAAGTRFGRHDSGRHGNAGLNALAPPSEVGGKGNPASDSRSMRRIIADDPEWSLATVPDLTELAVKHIVDNFASQYSSTNQLIPVTSRRRRGTRTDTQDVMVAHRLLLSAMRSNDDNDWPVHL